MLLPQGLGTWTSKGMLENRNCALPAEGLGIVVLHFPLDIVYWGLGAAGTTFSKCMSMLELELELDNVNFDIPSVR